MRVSLVVGAVVAAAVATGGTAVAADATQSAAAKSLCWVYAKKDTPIYSYDTGMRVGTIKKGKTRDSACSPSSLKHKDDVVFLAGGGSFVPKSYVEIRAGV